MKIVNAIPVIAFLALSACVPQAAMDADGGDFTRIMTEAQFRDMVVGRNLTFSDGASALVFQRNNTISAISDGTPVGGSWRWSGDTACWVYDDGGREEQCRVVEASSNAFRYTRSGGSQETLSMR